jgi:hypothetical protein
LKHINTFVVPPTLAKQLGTMAFEAAEATELPTALVATTVKVYDVPLVNPVTINGELAPVAVKPPGEDVTV